MDGTFQKTDDDGEESVVVMILSFLTFSLYARCINLPDPFRRVYALYGMLYDEQVMLGSRERSREQWKTLLCAEGLFEMVNITPSATDVSVIECVKV